MKIYNYDPISSEYVGASDAFESPLEPGVFLIPASATDAAPPTFDAAKEQCFWTGSDWTVAPVKLGSAPTSPTADEIAAEAWSTYQEQAKAALARSDVTMLRCFESGITAPAAWVTYRKDLRAIVSAPSGDPTAQLPSIPPYPAN